MITTIKKTLQNGFNKVILWITLFALAGAFSIPMLFRQGGMGDPWALRINGGEISHRTLSHAVADQQERIAQFRAQYGQFADMLLESMGITIDPRSLAVDTLIRNELLVQIAKKMHLYLSPSYIQDAVNNREFVREHMGDVVPPFVFNQSGTIDENALRNYLKHKGISTSMFKDQVEKSLLRQMVTDLVQMSVYVPQFEINKKLSLKNEERQYALVAISLDRFLQEAEQSGSTEQELREYFNAREQDYWIPEKRAGKQWMFKAETYGITITNQEKEAYYQDYKTSKFVDTPAKIQVRQIVIDKDGQYENRSAYAFLAAKRNELVENPDTFSTVAQEISIDQESAQSGGLIDAFYRGQKDAEFEKAAFLLQNDGDISEIVEHGDQYILLQRVTKEPRTYKPFSAVQSDIEQTLLNKKFTEQFFDDVKAVIEDGLINEEQLSVFVKEHNGVVQDIDLQAKDESKISQTLFRLQQGKSSSYVEKDSGSIVTLESIQKRYLPDFASVSEQVKQHFYGQKAAKSMQEMLSIVKSRMGAESLQDIASNVGIHYEQTGWLSASEVHTDRLLSRYAISERDLRQLENVGSLYTHEQDGQYCIVQLLQTRVKDDVAQSSSKDEQSIYEDLEREYQQLIFGGFVASLYRNATIETNDFIPSLPEDFSI